MTVQHTPGLPPEWHNTNTYLKLDSFLAKLDRPTRELHSDRMLRMFLDCTDSQIKKAVRYCEGLTHMSCV